MVNDLKILATCFVSIVILDFIWIGLIAKTFYTIQMSPIGRIYNGQFRPVIWAAAFVYLFLSIGIIYFVLPRIEIASGPLFTFFTGALMGLLIYGVYDLTNYSTLKDWTLLLTVVDILWGAIVCGTTTCIARFVRDLSLG